MSKKTACRLRTVVASDVRPEPVDWLWKPWIPSARLTLLVGDPAAGKSTITCAIAAAVTRGTPLPGDNASIGPASVLMISGEDGIADTIRPRLETAGADLERVHVLEALESDGEPEWLMLKRAEHLAAIEAEIAHLRPALVIIDPLSAYLGEIDSTQDSRVRGVLAPLAKLAEEYGCAVICVMHLRKADADKALYRIGGSIGFGASARSVLLAGSEPDAPDTRALVHLKSNLAHEAATEGYQIVGKTITAGSIEIETSAIEWTGQSDLTAERMFARADEHGGATDEAEDFLRAELASGPVPAQQVFADAKDQGISKDRIKRAKQRLIVSSCKTGMDGGWTWSLPEGAHSPPLLPSLPSAPSKEWKECEGAEGSDGDAARLFDGEAA